MENWENPAIRSDNLLPAHACFSEESLSLGGKWRFYGLSGDSLLPEGWTEPDFNDRKWDKISVPGNWEAEPDLVLKHTEIGLYRRSFILSREQGSRQIILRFEALPNSTALWINGIYIGKAAGLGVPCEFDITHAVRPEKNILCVLIRREHDGQKRRFSGLPADVSLYSLPARAITQLSAVTCWSEYGSPLLDLSVSVRNSNGFTLRIALMDGNRLVCYRECPIDGDTSCVQLPCPDVELWCAEHPKLYRVAVILWDGVAMYHTRELTVGFRRIVRENGAVLLNGQPEKLFATEYDTKDPKNGCYLTYDQMEADLIRLKVHHFNSIRLKDSAPDSLYPLCDQLGVYILDTPNGANPHHGDVFGSHPSILAWNAVSDHPGILGMDEISVVTDPGISLTGLKTVLLSLASCHGKLEPIITRIRETDSILGAVFCNITSQLREIRSLLQPMAFSYEDGKLTITNLSRFRSTGDYVCKYLLTRDGETVFTRDLDLRLLPGETKTLFLDTQYDIFKPGRYYLTVGFVRPENGASVATAQWPVAHLRHIFDENPGGNIREDKGVLLLRSGEASYSIDRSTGILDQISLGDRPLLAAPIYHLYCSESGKNAAFLLADEWEKHSGSRRKRKPSVLEVDHMTRTVSASYKLGSGLIQNCRLHSDGSMSFELRLRTGRTAPDRFALCLPLAKELGHFRWFGLGPDDADQEHQAGRFFAVHAQNASDASSTGAKEPVYHLTVTDQDGKGLLVRSEEGLRASLRSTADGNQLTLELPQRDLKPHTTYTFSFILQPITE